MFFSNYTFFDLFFSEFYRTLSIMNTFDYFFKITNSYIVSIELYQYNFLIENPPGSGSVDPCANIVALPLSGPQRPCCVGRVKMEEKELLSEGKSRN